MFPLLAGARARQLDHRLDRAAVLHQGLTRT